MKKISMLVLVCFILLANTAYAQWRDNYPEATRAVAVRLIPSNEYCVPKDGDWSIRCVSVNKNLTIEDAIYVAYLTHEGQAFINGTTGQFLIYPIMLDVMGQVESHHNWYDKTGNDWGPLQINRCWWGKRLDPSITFGTYNPIEIDRIDKWHLVSDPRYAYAVGAWEFRGSMLAAVKRLKRDNHSKQGDMFYTYLLGVTAYNSGRPKYNFYTYNRYANHIKKIEAVYDWQTWVNLVLLDRFGYDAIVAGEVTHQEMEEYIVGLCS